MIFPQKSCRPLYHLSLICQYHSWLACLLKRWNPILTKTHRKMNRAHSDEILCFDQISYLHEMICYNNCTNFRRYHYLSTIESALSERLISLCLLLKSRLDCSQALCFLHANVDVQISSFFYPYDVLGVCSRTISYTGLAKAWYWSLGTSSFSWSCYYALYQEYLRLPFSYVFLLWMHLVSIHICLEYSRFACLLKDIYNYR